MRLKKQAKKLAEYDSSFNSLRNSITTHVNAMNGTLNEERRTKLKELFEKHFGEN
ncbi:hypothetical protein K9M48_00835 [Candidatus Gracilibacteria bacterium]|nr:hypothetical protein [Candidatus Gracilibacteria bacterium]